MMYLQRTRDAKRIYANVVYSKANCDGYKLEGITYPSGEIQEALLSEFYTDLRLDPTSLSYVEAHSTGTTVGDPEECKALDNIFCKNRTDPLLVGSVKSNIGHTESSSGACSIIKVILAFESGKVAPNINFEKVRTSIPPLAEKRMIVCTEPTPLKGDKIAVNSFGFGGANGGSLLIYVLICGQVLNWLDDLIGFLFFALNISSRIILDKSKNENQWRNTTR